MISGSCKVVFHNHIFCLSSRHRAAPPAPSSDAYRTRFLELVEERQEGVDERGRMSLDCHIPGMGACSRGYAIAGSSGTGATKRALGKGGTPLGDASFP